MHLFLRANFTSNIRRDNQTFHHDKNLSGLYKGGFPKLFGLTAFPGLFKQNYTKLDHTLHYITQHYIQIKYHTKRKRRCH